MKCDPFKVWDQFLIPVFLFENVGIAWEIIIDFLQAWTRKAWISSSGPGRNTNGPWNQYCLLYTYIEINIVYFKPGTSTWEAFNFVTLVSLGRKHQVYSWYTLGTVGYGLPFSTGERSLFLVNLNVVPCFENQLHKSILSLVKPCTIFLNTGLALCNLIQLSMSSCCYCRDWWTKKNDMRYDVQVFGLNTITNSPCKWVLSKTWYVMSFCK